LRLIAGLGNPGPYYAATRHNAGFWVADELAARARLTFMRQGDGYVARGSIVGQDVVLVKPLEFMNESGPVLARVIEEFGLPLHDMIVVHDDLDLDPGRVRLKARGGHGGHNGVLSIIQSLGTDEFPRVKIGTGRPAMGIDAADYVLAPMSSHDRAVLAQAIELAVSAVECWIAEGLAAAMNRFNGSAATDLP